jgi:hypothetical protein
MASQDHSYQRIRKKLMHQLKRCRDRDVRIRAEVILCALKLGNVELACKRLGFGRSFYYKWWRRLVAGKFRLRALQDRSRRPETSPRSVTSHVRLT